jgi:hypothetical protein
MKLSNDTRIAGTKTVAHWAAMKGRLTGSPIPTAWTDAFNDFFKGRLESRYFEPISAIAAIEKDVGEGFAIVALHCSLIEFLAATLKGKTYKYQRNGKPTLNQFEYANSRDMFVDFLESNEPFKSMFSRKGSALDFYKSVRCGSCMKREQKEIGRSGYVNQLRKLSMWTRRLYTATKCSPPSTSS